MFHSRILPLLLLLTLSGALATQAQDSPVSGKADTNTAANPLDEKYRIGYRDKVNVQIYRHPDLSQTYSVNPNGTINLFRLPEPVVAVCKTERELALDIAEAYKKDYLRNPEVNVTVAEQLSQSLSVIGAVEKPNSYFVKQRMHLLDLLALAGGPSKEAGSRVLVARTGNNFGCNEDSQIADDKVGLYDFKIRDLQEGKTTFLMQPGDIVSVLKADIVYVYGNVNEQGPVTMEQPITLTQAIVSAKGLRPATKKDKVRILRQKPGSLEREEMVYDLNAIDARKVEDPYLQPNDIVALSEDKTKSILNNVAKSFTQGIPGLLYRPY